MALFVGDIMLPAFFIFLQNEIFIITIFAVLLFFGITEFTLTVASTSLLIYEVIHGAHLGSMILAGLICSLILYQLGHFFSIRPIIQNGRSLIQWLGGFLGVMLVVLFEIIINLESVIIFHDRGFSWPGIFSAWFAVYVFIVFQIFFFIIKRTQQARPV